MTGPDTPSTRGDRNGDDVPPSARRPRSLALIGLGVVVVIAIVVVVWVVLYHAAK